MVRGMGVAIVDFLGRLGSLIVVVTAVTVVPLLMRKSCITLRTLNYGTFLIVGNAGFISSIVVVSKVIFWL